MTEVVRFCLARGATGMPARLDEVGPIGKTSQLMAEIEGRGTLLVSPHLEREGMEAWNGLSCAQMKLIIKLAADPNRPASKKGP